MAQSKDDLSKRGRNSRRKGAQFERDVANALRLVWPYARRHLENHEDDAAEGRDLMNTGDYRFQLKKLKNYAPINCIKEVKTIRELGEIPVLVTAGNGTEPMAVLPFEELIRLFLKAGIR